MYYNSSADFGWRANHVMFATAKSTKPMLFKLNCQDATPPHPLGVQLCGNVACVGEMRYTYQFSGGRQKERDHFNVWVGGNFCNWAEAGCDGID